MTPVLHTLPSVVAITAVICVLVRDAAAVPGKDGDKPQTETVAQDTKCLTPKAAVVAAMNRAVKEVKLKNLDGSDDCPIALSVTKEMTEADEFKDFRCTMKSIDVWAIDKIGIKITRTDPDVETSRSSCDGTLTIREWVSDAKKSGASLTSFNLHGCSFPIWCNRIMDAATDKIAETAKTALRTNMKKDFDRLPRWWSSY